MKISRLSRVERPPGSRRVTSGLPSANDEPNAYVAECLRRLRASVERFARIEARMEQLERYYIEKTGSQAAGIVAADSDDEIIRALAPDRAVALRRVAVYADAIQAELHARQFGDAVPAASNGNRRSSLPL